MLERTSQPVFGNIPHGPDGLETEADHANAFNQSLGRTVKEIIFRGMVCISAKRKFPGRYESWVRDTLNCSRGYAFKCKAITENKFVADASNWKHLPTSTAALYALSAIPAERLRILVDGGELHCRLKIHEAEALAEAEKGEYIPRKRASAPAQRQRRPSRTAEDEDADTHETDFPPSSDGDGEIDLQRLLIDAEDIGEELKQAFALCRRRIDTIETHSGTVAKEMLANELREIASSLIYRADALDPPTNVVAESEDEDGDEPPRSRSRPPLRKRTQVKPKKKTKTRGRR